MPDPSRVLLGAACGALPLALSLFIARRTHTFSKPLRLRIYVLWCIGFALGAVARELERIGLELTGASPDASVSGAAGALLVMVLFVAPLEEGLKLLPVWRLYAQQQIVSHASGVSYACTSAAGFAALDMAIYAFTHASALGVLRAALGALAHLFFAGIWGYALGAHGHRFTVSWLSSVLLHGVYDHIVFARGPGLLPLVTPLLVAMALAAVSVRGELDQEPVSSRRRALLGESPSLRDVQRALRRPNRPLMIHWIAIGAFVTLGTLIAFFAIALLVGRRLGIDFALANEGDARSSAPLILIGAAVLASFPASACLVARASRATSLVEPVIGSGLCIALILLLVALTAPLGVLVAFAMAPAAFLLACGGAWFGLSRQ